MLLCEQEQERVYEMSSFQGMTILIIWSCEQEQERVYEMSSFQEMTMLITWLAELLCMSRAMFNEV